MAYSRDEQDDYNALILRDNPRTAENTRDLFLEAHKDHPDGKDYIRDRDRDDTKTSHVYIYIYIYPFIYCITHHIICIYIYIS